MTIAGLLANVSDADGDPLRLVGVSPTAANRGIVVINNGRILYPPAPGSTNADTFTYVVLPGESFEGGRRSRPRRKLRGPA